MKKIKTFKTVINVLNDDEINEFIENHNVESIKSYVSQGFAYGAEHWIKPLLITRIIYDD